MTNRLREMHARGGHCLELQAHYKYVLICTMSVLGMYLVRTGTYWYEHGKTKKLIVHNSGTRTVDLTSRSKSLSKILR